MGSNPTASAIKNSMSKERENELFNYLKELLVDIKHQYVSNGDLVQEMYDLVEAFPEVIKEYEKELNL